MKRRSLLVLGLLVLGAMTATPTTRAAFVITASSSPVVLAPGGTTTLDLLISSDPTDPSTALSAYALDLQIVRGLGVTTNVEFTTPQPDSFISTAGSGYVFGTDNTASSNSTQPGGSRLGPITTTVFTNDSFLPLDSSTLANGATLTAANNLLIRLTLTATTAQAGDTFSLVLNSGANTFFLDGDFEEVGYTFSPVAITVAGTPPPVIPEPSSLCLIGLGSLSALAAARRRARRGA